MQERKIIGIAGGSGSGKSTLAISLCQRHPDEFTLLHIDDYFQKKELVPKVDGLTNWDCPEAIRFDNLYNDLLILNQGKSVTILTKSELYNPNYSHDLRNKIEHVIDPKNIILLEGYLALLDRRIRELMSLKIFLDIPIEESSKRRSANKFALDEIYFKSILTPMYKEFVEPTKSYADLVVDVRDKTKEEVFSIVESQIQEVLS